MIKQFLLGFFALFSFELFSLKLGNVHKPSVVLTVAKCAQDAFLYLGKFIVKLSSFYTYLEDLWYYIKEFLGDVAVALRDLLRPIWEVLVFPFWTIKGYVENIKFYEHPYVVICGTHLPAGTVSLRYRS